MRYTTPYRTVVCNIAIYQQNIDVGKNRGFRRGEHRGVVDDKRGTRHRRKQRCTRARFTSRISTERITAVLCGINTAVWMMTTAVHYTVSHRGVQYRGLLAEHRRRGKPRFQTVGTPRFCGFASRNEKVTVKMNF